MSRLLWIRSESFDHGVFNTSIRWTVTKVIEFMVSLRQATDALCLTRSTWVDVATTRCKPALTEAEAHAFWSVVGVLQKSVLGLSPDLLDVRNMGLVLMCQLVSPHRAQSSHIAKSPESWPSMADRAPSVSSPRHSPRSGSPRVAASTQPGRGMRETPQDCSAMMLSFLRQHFGFFLQIACSSATELTESSFVSTEEFDLLSLFLCSGSSFAKPFKSLSEVVPDFVSKGRMPFKELSKWTDNNLVWNHEVYAHVEPSGSASPSPGIRAKTVCVNGLSKTTWFQRSPSTQAEYLNITNCTDCVIYVTTPPRFCLVSGCHECTIIMVAVSALCTIQNSEKVSVHVAAHCFKMENCIDSSAYVYCRAPPILTGDTRGIKLAPFNVLYSQSSNVLASAGLSFDAEFSDSWAHPVCCTLGSPDETLGGRKGNDEDNNSTYHFVHPKDFLPVVIPESSKPGSRSSSPVPSGSSLILPEVYNDAFKSRIEEMQAFHRQMAKISDENTRKRAQLAIQGHFREWLQSTGKSRQLADLARMAQMASTTQAL